MHDGGWFSCRAKTRFDTEHVAERHARRFGQRAYSCSRCGGWHCSKQPVDPGWYRRTPQHTHPTVELDRARRGLAELRRKNITGPLRDAAERTVRELEAQTQGGRER